MWARICVCVSMDNYANCTRSPDQLALSGNTRLAYATATVAGTVQTGQVLGEKEESIMQKAGSAGKRDHT